MLKKVHCQQIIKRSTSKNSSGCKITAYFQALKKAGLQVNDCEPGNKALKWIAPVVFWTKDLLRFQKSSLRKYVSQYLEKIEIAIISFWPLSINT